MPSTCQDLSLSAQFRSACRSRCQKSCRPLSFTKQKILKMLSKCESINQSSKDINKQASKQTSQQASKQTNTYTSNKQQILDNKTSSTPPGSMSSHATTKRKGHRPTATGSSCTLAGRSCLCDCRLIASALPSLILANMLL